MIKKEWCPKEWHKGAIIYQIYPRSFLDTNNDGIGDLRGIIAKLDYIKSLGVDGIWISPFFKSPMKDFGYDISDYREIDPIFGKMQDFDELLQKAHSLDLKVIIDQVYSHTSNEHEWFLKSHQNHNNEYSDYYVWADPKPDGSPPNNWQSVFFGPSWEWDAHRNQYYFHNFLPSQPDLNLHNPKVQTEILEIAKFWLDKGVDGFRLDALNFLMHNPSLADNPPNPNGKKARPFDYQLHINNMSSNKIPIFLDRLGEVLESYEGERFSVAEIVGDNAINEMKAFTKKGRLSTSYGFVFLYANELTPKSVKEAFKGWENSEEWPSWAFSNHDAPRAASRFAKGRDLNKMAKCLNALLLCLRGNIFMYQGEELGLNASNVPFEDLTDPEAIANYPNTLGRDSARTPMAWDNSQYCGFSNHKPWLPIDAHHKNINIDAQEKDIKSVLNFTREIIKLRKKYPALLYGDIKFIEASENLLIFEREYQGQKVICSFNLGYDSAESIIIDNILPIYLGETDNQKLEPMSFSINLVTSFR